MTDALAIGIGIFAVYAVLKSWTNSTDDKNHGPLMAVLFGIAVIALWAFESGGAEMMRDSILDQQSPPTTSPWLPDP